MAWYVYQGLSEKEKQSIKDRFKPKGPTHDGFEYPRTAKLDYHYRKRDDEADRARKDARRKKYREMRIAEMKDDLVTLDEVRHVAGIVFKRGEPKEVDLGRLEEGEVKKLAGLVEAGTLKEVSEDEMTAPKAKAKPEQSKGQAQAQA